MAGTPRAFWITLGAVIAVIAGGLGLTLWTMNPSSLKPKLIEAVERATGRTMTVSGGMGLTFSFPPTISLEQVTLSNPPGANPPGANPPGANPPGASGFSQPDMVKIARVELSLALVPLIEQRVEIENVVVLRPEVLLETNASGAHNWTFKRQPSGRQPAGAPAEAVPAAPNPPSPPSAGGSGEGGSGFTVAFTDVDIQDGRVIWADAASGRHVEVDVPKFTLNAPPGGPVQLSGDATYEGRKVVLTGRVGVAELAPATILNAAIPLTINIQSGGASVTAQGQFARPRDGRGYRFTIDGDVPDMAAFASLFPNVPMAAFKAVNAHVELLDDGGEVPAITSLDGKIGSADLGVMVHAPWLEKNVRLDNVTITGRLKRPLGVSARMVLPGLDTGVSGTIGDLPWLANGMSGPVPIDLEWAADAARADAKGTIQAPLTLSGFALDVTANVPEPAIIIDGAPPNLKSIAFQTHLTDAPGPIPFQLTSSAGDLSGELSVSRRPRLTVEGHVDSHRLDLDALRLGAASKAAADPPAAPAAGNGSTGGSNEAGVAAAPGAGWIPATKLPFDVVRSTDSDLKVNLAQVRWQGVDIDGVAAALLMKDGVLHLDPFSIASPDQHLNASLVADASKTPAEVHLTAQAPSVALKPLLALLGVPQVASGAMEVHGDLTGTGDTPRALAASLDGWAGLAIEGGQLDPRYFNTWLEQLRPLRIDAGTATDIRCFAVRADAKHGIVAIHPVALNTAALIVDGSGEIDLAHDTMTLNLRPRAKIGGAGFAVPVRVSGPINAPSAKIDISPTSSGGGFAGLLLGGKEVMGAAGGGDPCPAALAGARSDALPPQAGANASPPAGKP